MPTLSKLLSQTVQEAAKSSLDAAGPVVFGPFWQLARPVVEPLFRELGLRGTRAISTPDDTLDEQIEAWKANEAQYRVQTEIVQAVVGALDDVQFQLLRQQAIGLHLLEETSRARKRQVRWQMALGFRAGLAWAKFEGARGDVDDYLRMLGLPSDIRAVLAGQHLDRDSQFPLGADVPAIFGDRDRDSADFRWSAGADTAFLTLAAIVHPFAAFTFVLGSTGYEGAISQAAERAGVEADLARHAAGVVLNAWYANQVRGTKHKHITEKERANHIPATELEARMSQIFDRLALSA